MLYGSFERDFMLLEPGSHLSLELGMASSGRCD